MINSEAVPKRIAMMILSERVNLFISSPRINFLKLYSSGWGRTMKLRNDPLCFFSVLMTREWMSVINGNMSKWGRAIEIEYFVSDDHRRSSSHSIILMAI